MQYCPMQVGGGDAFIELEKLLGLVGVSFRTAHPRRHRATSPANKAFEGNDSRSRNGGREVRDFRDRRAKEQELVSPGSGREPAVALAQPDILQFGERARRNRLDRNDGLAARVGRYRSAE